MANNDGTPKVDALDLWCWKRPLCMLSHNHCPSQCIFGSCKNLVNSENIVVKVPTSQMFNLKATNELNNSEQNSLRRKLQKNAIVVLNREAKKSTFTKLTRLVKTRSEKVQSKFSALLELRC